VAASKSGIKAAEEGQYEDVKASSNEDTRAVQILAVNAPWPQRVFVIVVSADLDILCDTRQQAREFHEDIVH
jgi:hypothetical protein